MEHISKGLDSSINLLPFNQDSVELNVFCSDRDILHSLNLVFVFFLIFFLNLFLHMFLYILQASDYLFIRN